MNQETFKTIDEVISQIKQKGYSNELNKSDFFFIITLEIVMYEILTTGKISDRSAEALTQLFVFQRQEYYYGQYPELYNQCGNLFSILIKYNQRLQNNELSSLGVKDKHWKNYFEKSIETLIVDNPPNN